jgi:hypothetical protein
MTPILAIAFVALSLFALFLWNRQIVLRRESFIRSADLPRGLFENLRKHHPHLTLKDCQLVASGLRQFFLAYLKSGRQYVSMPSQVVDDLWHEFILNTRSYELFCRNAFGRFMHHTPAVALDSGKQSNTGLRRVWWHACKNDQINPRKPSRLPLLFALDTKLNIANGFHYAADCAGLRRRQGDGGALTVVYCGGDFGSTSFDGGTDGFGDSHGGHGDSGGSSGDSGGGDGGGCGGGGCGS